MPPPNIVVDDFIARTGKSLVAVIVPLYGYWSDVANNPLVEENVLPLVLNRVYSSVHNLIVIFVANPETLPNNAEDPNSVANVLLARSRGGNTFNLPIRRDAPYPEYIAKGMEYALNETKAQFMVVLNPWVMIKHGGIDVIVDRANRGDEAKAITGYDLTPKVSPDGFEVYKNPMLAEEYDISFNFFCIPRFAAEFIKWDTPYQTHTFFEHDVAQTLRHVGYAAISSPQAGIFPFDFTWEAYEPESKYQQDQDTFTKKWGFSLALKPKT